ncbi:hypothetical protein KFS98_003625 [Salmonella enterica]|nr:hypothetical protein [Salmonella enterica]
MEYSDLAENFSFIQKQFERKEIISTQALDKTYASILAFVFTEKTIDPTNCLMLSGMLDSILELTDKGPDMAHIRMRIKSYSEGLRQGKALTMDELLTH